MVKSIKGQSTMEFIILFASFTAIGLWLLFYFQLGDQGGAAGHAQVAATSVIAKD
jgi:hypothetical protein